MNSLEGIIHYYPIVGTIVHYAIGLIGMVGLLWVGALPIILFGQIYLCFDLETAIMITKIKAYSPIRGRLLHLWVSLIWPLMIVVYPIVKLVKDWRANRRSHAAS